MFPKLTVKYVNVIPRSLFEQTMMGWSPQCYMYIKFRGNWRTGSGEEDF